MPSILPPEQPTQVADSHGTYPPSWWLPARWPSCICGYNPMDNILLAAHYAEYGFREVDHRGQIVREAVAR